jgi:hypothetical protein
MSYLGSEMGKEVGKGETCDRTCQPCSEMNKGSVEVSGIWR